MAPASDSIAVAARFESVAEMIFLISLISGHFAGPPSSSRMMIALSGSSFAVVNLLSPYACLIGI